ncbi:MipA/OmpV family protein [Caulobacter segnis]
MTPALAPIALLCVLTAVSLATKASAQDRGPNRAVVGGAVIYAPAYQGGEDYRVLPFPLIDLKYGRFFASSRRGIGANLVDGDAVDVGASVTFVPGYRRRDAPLGIGRVSGGAGARISADVKAGMVMASIGATKVLSGDLDGALVDATLAMPFRPTDRLTVIPSVSTTWADGAYTRSYFGVSPVQATASGLPAYRPGGGIKDVSASLTASYRLNDQVSLSATGSVSKLTGDARKSPIVVDPTQPLAVLSVSYRF